VSKSVFEGSGGTGMTRTKVSTRPPNDKVTQADRRSAGAGDSSLWSNSKMEIELRQVNRAGNSFYRNGGTAGRFC
jgi:hypothetical protein